MTHQKPLQHPHSNHPVQLRTSRLHFHRCFGRWISRFGLENDPDGPHHTELLAVGHWPGRFHQHHGQSSLPATTNVATSFLQDLPAWCHHNGHGILIFRGGYPVGHCCTLQLQGCRNLRARLLHQLLELRLCSMSAGGIGFSALPMGLPLEGGDSRGWWLDCGACGAFGACVACGWLR